MDSIEEILQLIKEEKYDECLVICEKKLKIYPENSIAIFGVAFALYHRGEYEKSYIFIQKNLIVLSNIFFKIRTIKCKYADYISQT